MRFYSFVNYYLSQIQHGIQTAHCAVDMRTKYPAHPYDISKDVMRSACDMYTDWATNHKTVVLLNGGNQQSLYDLWAMFDHPANPYPISYFQEDEQSLNNALTCVGIILPEKIYEGANLLRDRRSNVRRVSDGVNIIVSGNGEIYEHEYTTWEIEMMQRLIQYRLA